MGKLTRKGGVEKRDKIFLIENISQNENQRHYVFLSKERSSGTQRDRKVQSVLQNWTQ